MSLTLQNMKTKTLPSLHCASMTIKPFIYPTNAQYIICRYNENYKIFKSTPTCFGSQRIHHQGALYSAWLKITGMVLSCPLTWTRSAVKSELSENSETKWQIEWDHTTQCVNMELYFPK